MRAAARSRGHEPTRCEMEALIIIGIFISLGPIGGGKAGW
jgi:hypothetical protein